MKNLERRYKGSTSVDLKSNFHLCASLVHVFFFNSQTNHKLSFASEHYLISDQQQSSSEAEIFHSWPLQPRSAGVIEINRELFSSSHGESL